MQQSISFESSAHEQQTLDVRATIQCKMKSINCWLNSKSRFYTHICEFPITRLLAIRINLVALCLTVAAVTIEQQPVITMLAALYAARLVYRINKTDKKQKGDLA